MKAIKIINNNELQVYKIEKPTKEFKKEFNKKNIIISFSPYENSIITKLTDNFKDPLIFTCLCYVFSYADEKTIKKEFSHINNIEFDYMKNKKCGMNGVNQDIYTKNNNVVLSLMSLESETYNANYLGDEYNITTNINELSKLDNNTFNKTINKIVQTASEPVKDFNNFIKILSRNCPINYGGSLRKFNNVITEEDLKKCKEMKNSYYIGYDIRFSNNHEENKLNNIIENLVYNREKETNEFIFIYETYNNPIENIIKECKNKNIKYIQCYDKCLRILAKDYEKLKLTASVSDYI